MKPRITVITIGVDNLERSLQFYRDGLKLETEGIVGKEFDHGTIAFFDLQAGLRLAIWPRKILLMTLVFPKVGPIQRNSPLAITFLPKLKLIRL